jgi:hypothetical protein
VLLDKGPVGRSVVFADADNLDVPARELIDVLLKLNKFGRSVPGVVLGVKGDDGPPVICQYMAQGDPFAILVGQGEIPGHVTHDVGRCRGAMGGAATENQ